MRAFALSLTLLTAGASPAPAETLLDTVLYVVSTLGAREDIGVKVTVVQDAESLHAEMFTSTRSDGSWGPFRRLVSVSVKRIADCKFEVDETFRTHHDDALYSVDFSGADLAGAYPSDVPNNSGRLSHAIVIPGARFCQAAGRPYFNNIGVGSCAGSFAVGPAFLRRDDDKMLAAIHRLETFCKAKVSLLRVSVR